MISGGGARNPTLLKAIAEETRGKVVTADSLGWNGDALEAQAFAFLAVRSLRGLPISFPGTTGAPRPLTGRPPQTSPKAPCCWSRGPAD